MKKLMLVVITLLGCICATAQKSTTPKDTTHYYYDTVPKTLCWYVTDLTTGHSNTGYLKRVVKSKMDFKAPTAEQLSQDQLTLKKEKIPVSVEYFELVPNSKGKEEWKMINSGQILRDFDGNLDSLLPKK
jgi:hypothetical protein